jgi:hypothetical protein
MAARDDLGGTVPLPEQNSAGWRLASTTSAWRVTAQYSVSGMPSSGTSG